METVGFITTVIVLLFIGVGSLSLLSRLLRPRKRQVKLAGTTIPEIGQGFDVSKRYDIVYSGGDYATSQVVERLAGVRIVGYVGKSDEGGNNMYMRDRWLVVEFADGRRAYLMPRSIVSLQESALA